MITLEVNGIEYQGFTEIGASRSFLSAPSSFSFTATTNPDDVTKFPIKTGDACRVLVDGKAFITGHVDTTKTEHDENSHQISVQGSSKVSDLVDSTMDGRFEIVGPIPLKTALEKIIALSGAEIKVLEYISPGDPVEEFSKDENLSGKIGEPVWAFMVELAIKKNVLITEDGNGNVIITRGSGFRVGDKFIKEPNSELNNILSSSCNRTQRQLYNTYTVLSQDDSASLASINFDDEESLESAVNKNAKYVDDKIRKSRLNCIMAEKASTFSECEARAIWQSNVSNVQSFSYACDHYGFTTESGVLIEPGMTAHVKDDYNQVNSDLIVDEVSISYTERGGSIASIKWLMPNAFTLQAEKPRESTGNDLQGFLL